MITGHVNVLILKRVIIFLGISAKKLPSYRMIWYALELLSSHLLELGLTGVYAVMILTFVGLCSNRLRRKKSEEERYGFDDQVGRRLGTFESTIDAFHSYGGSLQTVALLLRSNVSLRLGSVREILEHLPKKHPVLRMRIQEVEVKGKRLPLKCFIEMDEPYSVDFYAKSHKSAQNWESTFEKELLSPFDTSTGPLWRVRILREDFDPGDGYYNNTLVFTVHQAIADDTSMIKLCEDFLSLLNVKHHELKNSQSPSDQVKLKTVLPLRPPVTELMRRHIVLAPREKILLALEQIFHRLISKLMGQPRHQFMGIFPPTSLQDKSTIKKTCILPRHLSKEAVSQLERHCKENKCSVHGAVIAATSRAISTMLQNGKLQIQMTIPLCFNVNVRKDCSPPVSSDDLGCMSLDCEVKIRVPVIDVTKESFWSFVKKCTQELQQAIMKGKHLSTLKLIDTFHLDLPGKMYKVSKNKKLAGRSDTLISISNVGQHRFGSEDERRAFESKGVYFAGAGHNFGPVFGNNIVTINGELWWSVVYYSNVVTQETACQFADLVFKTLKCCSEIE